MKSTDLIVVFDAHAEGVDEDGEKNALLEVFVLHQAFDDATDGLETTGAARRHPTPGHSAALVPVVPLRHPATLQHHGPVAAARLFAAAKLVHVVLWAVAPSLRSAWLFSQCFHSCRYHQYHILCFWYISIMNGEGK